MPAFPSSLTLPALVDLPTGLLPAHEDCSTRERVSLVAELATVVDGRDARGLRHALLPILVVAVWAVMGGARSYAGIADAADDAEADLAVAIGIVHPRWGRPHPGTIRRALLRLEVATLEAALRRWATRRALAEAAARAARPPSQVGPTRALRATYALDGKIVRGSVVAGPDTTEHRVGLVAVLDVASGVVLTQNSIDGGDEVAAAHTTLEDLHEAADLGGCLVTADARHTVRATAAQLLGYHAHYLFRVRGNTPTLHTLLKRQPWGSLPGHQERGRGHGRRESRSVKVANLTGTQLAEVHAVFPGATQLIKIVRRRKELDGTRTRARKKIKNSVEVVYYVTSLSYREADPALIASWARQHWAIENNVHHVRDVTLGEDASRVRTAGGPQVMAALRNLIISLARLADTGNIARTTRRWCRRGREALHVLLTA